MLRESAKHFLMLIAGTGVLFSGAITEAGEVKWNKDIRQAARQASEQNKPMMVMVSAPWCGYCQQMLKTTFRDEKLIEHVNDCFVPVYLDADDNEEWVEKLEVDGLPTTLIVSPDMKVVQRLSGYQSAGQLNGQIVKLCKHTKATAPPQPAKPLPITKAEFDGACLVSLRDDGKLFKATGQWSSSYNGRVLWFASADHKRRFDEKPASYWPVADGKCLVSDRIDRKNRAGQPVLAMIYADRVWFFVDKDHQDEFVSNPKFYLAQLRNTQSSIPRPMTH